MLAYGSLVVIAGALLMLLEWRLGADYERRDTAANATLGLLKVSAGAAAKLAWLPLFQWCYEHRTVELGRYWLVLLVAEDLCFYGYHRSHHAVRLLWAAHVSHHSSRRYNLSTALRQTVLTAVTSPVFWLPLAFLGFAPWQILVAQTWSQVYQFLLHTEAVGRLGPFELVLNTPSHHRVHHGKNPQYLDRNHGGIFIAWDRLFGTFEPEGEPVVYGLTHDLDSFNPGTILFHEVTAIARDVRRTPTWRGKLAQVFGRP